MKKEKNDKLLDALFSAGAKKYVKECENERFDLDVDEILIGTKAPGFTFKTVIELWKSTLQYAFALLLGTFTVFIAGYIGQDFFFEINQQINNILKTGNLLILSIICLPVIYLAARVYYKNLEVAQ